MAETSDRESTVAETEETKEESATEGTENVSGMETESFEEFVVPEAAEGLYDRTYLKESNGTYSYRIEELSVIGEYEKLYAVAFADVVASNLEVRKWMFEEEAIDRDYVAGNLLYTEGQTGVAIKTGSNFEMDYDFDLNNVGYTYVDLNSDGIFELIFGVLDSEWLPLGCFERAYTLMNGHPVKIFEGGCRDLYWLGNDGWIYEEGSGGAANSGIWKLRFVPSGLQVDKDLNWGSNGFVDEEFLGYWEVPVHIEGTFGKLDSAAKMPENQISEDELGRLYEEWEARRVKIEWLRMADYMDEHYPEGM